MAGAGAKKNQMLEPETWVPGAQTQFCRESEVVQIIQWFFVFNGPDRSGAGTINF